MDPRDDLVFISYRREDSEHAARQIYEALIPHFAVFWDREQIADGRSFPQEIVNAIDNCQAMIVVIGRGWLRANDKAGRRRIDLDEDWVATEIALALDLGRRLIPVLVDGAELPPAEHLPLRLRSLVLQQARQLHNDYFKAGLDRIIEHLQMPTAKDTRTGTGFVAVPPPRLIRPAPSLVPFKIHDRFDDVDRLFDAVTSGSDRILALSGQPGSGKTAVVSALFDKLLDDSTVVTFGSIDYIAASGYMSVTGASLVEALAEAVSDPDLRAVLRSPVLRQEVSWPDKVEEVLQAIDRPALVVIDQVDDLLTDDGSFQDAALSDLLQELVQRPDHRVTVLLVGGRRPQRQLPGWRSNSSLELDGGLPRDHAERLLDDLTAGLPPDPRLEPSEWAVSLTGGHPRSLELLVAALAVDPHSGADTFQHIALLDREQRLEAFVDHVLERLDDTETEVTRALAALGLPATADEVEAVLEGTSAADEARPTLERLSRVRFVRHSERGRYYLPGSPEAERALARLGTDAHGLSLRSALLRRAAAVMATRKRREQVTRVEDLAPHFREIDLLLQAGDVDEPAELMETLDRNHLTRFGHKYVLVPWRKRVAGRLGDHQLERSNYSAMAAAARQQTAYREALDHLESAERTLADDYDEPEALTLLRQRASVRYLAGDIDAAARDNAEAAKRALALPASEPERDWAIAAALVNRAECLAELGRFDEAQSELDSVPISMIADNEPQGAQLHAVLILCQAGIHRCVGEFTQARRAYVRAETSASAYSQPLLARCVDARAALLLDDNLIAEALMAAEQASRIAAGSGVADLSRQANATLALAYLRAGRLDDARRAANDAARFSRNRKVVSAHLLQGIVALHFHDGSTAQTAFLQALGNTRSLTSRAPRAFEFQDSLALALTGLAFCARQSAQYHDDALRAFSDARDITAAPGVLRRVDLLLRALTSEVEDPDAVADIRAAALGEKGG